MISINAFSIEVDITKLSLPEIKKYEVSFLEKLKQQNATNEEIQEKYLLAAKKFSEVEEHEKAFYLLRKGLEFSTPSIEYSYIYLNYIQSLDKQKEFVPAFEKLFGKLDSSRIDKMTVEEVDQATEHIVTYMRIKNTPSSGLSTELKKIIEKSSIKTSIYWNDSIISARAGKYEKAYELLNSVETIGEADNIYKSYLQAKLGKIPKYCLSIVTFPQKLESFYSKKICKLLAEPGKKSDLDRKLRETGELLEFTPLYEVLKK